MRVDFKRIPFLEKSFDLSFDKKDVYKVKFEGTFCKLPSFLVKVDYNLQGTICKVCDRCSIKNDFKVNESETLLLKKGFYKSNTKKLEDEMVVEIQDEFIDFEQLIDSEINSICSDYYICDDCIKSSDTLEQEF